MLESTEKYREEERKLQKQAHISRKTLYQYFSSKEEIAFEIEIQAFESFVTYQKKILKK